VFKGTYRLRIDPKGRLPVPAPFRRLLGSGVDHVVVTLLDQCIAAYPPSAGR
jgi:DNA-binding transcriptional regulator/RsmH inhibitor MraZ